jgi:uncharacterized Rmd1/YagE family protein
MKCTFYCTAEKYDFSKLLDDLNKQGLEPFISNDVIHVQKIKDNQEVVDICFFLFGCIVIWNENREVQNNTIINDTKQYESNSHENITQDFIDFEYNTDLDNSAFSELENKIILHKDDKLIKVAISYALAQSVKLEMLEKSINFLLQEIHPIQKEFAEKGNVSLSKNKISKQLGILFAERYFANMNSNVLDTPEFFWHRSNYEQIYYEALEFHEMRQRQALLNQRLSMVNDLYKMLSDQLHSKHSTKLEWIIIILIAIEVLLDLIKIILF